MNNVNNAGAVLGKIAKFSDKYRPVAERLHALIMGAEPTLQPKLWYGMPGYAKTEDGPVILFFREDKYISFGLTENANINVDGFGLVESAWFLTELNGATEKKISSIVRNITR